MMAGVANRLWLAHSAAEHRRFMRGLRNPRRDQTMVLERILSANLNAQFLREHDLKCTDYESFISRVPVRSSADFDSWLVRAADSHGVLTEETILYFEKTSGTSGKPRLVPYTATLRSEIDRAVSTWMVYLSHEFPAAFAGPSYWSISPPLRPHSERTKSCVKIGASDAEYLTPITRILLKQILVAEPCGDELSLDEFYFRTLRRLLLTPGLALVSVWSPTFLIVLNDHLQSLWRDLLRSLPARFVKKYPGKPESWNEIWKKLTVVSCWTDAWATPWLDSVTRILGDVPIQGKGLLATEGVTSIPSGNSHVLAFRSHFYEFRAESGQILRADQLERGSIYEVILTTSGGLYRYATADLVEVTGFAASTPCLKFLGRNRTSDLVGEKITEIQATECIAQLRESAKVDLHAALRSGPDRRYSLLICAQSEISAEDIVDLAARVDKILSKNPYYDHARRIGQLAPVQGCLISEEAWRLLAVGRFVTREGTSKIPALLAPEIAENP